MKVGVEFSPGLAWLIVSRSLMLLGIGVVLAHGADVDTPALNSRVGLKYILDACLTCG